MIAETRISVAVEVVEWSFDFKDGRFLVMEKCAQGYRTSLQGFSGVGPTQEAALDDLLHRMRDYVAASKEFSSALEPGGQLANKLQQIRQLLDQKLACPHCSAGEPSVWDGVLSHYAHPDRGAKLKFCHDPWRDRCRCCSRNPGQCARQLSMGTAETPT